jgi:CarboxypepD_reg-like domain
MSKKLQLSIADPCHENWDNMTQADRGRFCGSCQKQVIDFTNMSDSQLAAFFKKPSNGSVCGRFYGDQLGRDIEIPKKRIPWVKYFFQFALPAFLISMKATAQGNVNVKRISMAKPKPVCSVIMGDIEPARITTTGATKFSVVAEQVPPALAPRVSIGGKVIDENDNPVPYATIMIKERNISVPADSNGVFKFDNLFPEDAATIVVSSVGFKVRETIVTRQSDRDNLIIRLEPTNTLGEILVFTYGSVRRTDVTGAVTKIEKKTSSKGVEQKKTNSSAVTLYPNPVQRNSSFYITIDNDKDELMQLSVIDMKGGIVLNRTETIHKGFNRVQASVQSSWAAGILVMQLLNEKGQVVKAEKLIVQ